MSGLTAVADSSRAAPNLTSGSLLELTGVSKSFGQLHVIRSVDLSVRQGEVLGVIGPNGAGKSTLFNLIAGIHMPSGGSIRFDGKDLGPVEVWRRARIGIGRTYQIPLPFTAMSVFENVLVAAVHGGRFTVKEASDHCAEVLRETGLLHRHAQLAGSLNLLDRKRLELARALCLRPRLLLLDEVAGGLTDGECDILVELVQGIHARGMTLIWVEHILHALKRVAGRLAMLSGGSILSEGPCEQVLADPAVRDAYLGT